MKKENGHCLILLKEKKIKMKAYGARDFQNGRRRGRRESWPCGQAGELVAVVMRLLLYDCRGKLQCSLESYFGNLLETVQKKRFVFVSVFFLFI
jgi:hypothetical protein